ncbi:MAG: hypothetical protein U0531_18120 [Dehalococcoidia bacterium]
MTPFAASSACPPHPPRRHPGEREAAFRAFAEQYREYVAGLPGSHPSTLRSPLPTAWRPAWSSATPASSPQAYRAFLASLGGGQLPVGLGVTLTNPPRAITALAPDGPADRAGLKIGDVIAVDGRT